MINHIKTIETILFVADQQLSTAFYENILRKKADLNVPGMTEFIFADNFKLGLMPNDGIAKILSDKTPHPASGVGIPRCELYLYVENVEAEFGNALKHGAKLISPIELRNWGDRVCYFADIDGHIIAFAETVNENG